MVGFGVCLDRTLDVSRVNIGKSQVTKFKPVDSYMGDGLEKAIHH